MKYQIGDIVELFHTNIKMKITGFVVDNGYFVEYEISPVDKQEVYYCTENVIVGKLNE